MKLGCMQRARNEPNLKQNVPKLSMPRLHGLHTVCAESAASRKPVPAATELAGSWSCWGHPGPRDKGKPGCEADSTQELGVTGLFALLPR